MLFISNKTITGSDKNTEFLAENVISNHLYYCELGAKNKFEIIGSKLFMKTLKVRLHFKDLF